MKRILKYFGLFLLWSLFVSQIVLVGLTFLLNKFKINFNLYLKTYQRKEFLILFLVILIGSFIYFLINYSNKKTFKHIKKRVGGEYSHFLTKREILKSKDFIITNEEKLKKLDSGVVINTERSNKGLIATIAKPNHTLIIGTTGSGKNVGYLDNNIYTLSNTKEKPSLIIADPKGENFSKHSENLVKNGYIVKIIDLRNPYQSSKWNPFDIVIKKINRINEIKEYVIEDYVENIKNLTSDEKVEIQELQDQIMSDTKDIINTMFPTVKSSDMTWQEGARNLILAFAIAMIEDIQENKYENLTIKNLIPYNIFYNISKYATDNCMFLKKYIQDRSKFSKAPSLAGAVLSSIDSDRTLASYLSTVQSLIQRLSDTGILSLTSENEINFSQADEKQTAIFICIPDEKTERHPFATLFLAQAYKSLVYKARKNFLSKQTKDMNLKRHTYFFLDEFGNLPKFHNLENMITVARSRHIFFHLVIQSYEQLETVYDNKISKVVKDNCNIKIFLGTTGKSTLDEISAICGKRIVENYSMSTSEQKGKMSSSTSAKEVPLITPAELSRLNNSDDIGNGIALMFGHYPIKIKFEPSYKSRIVNLKFKDNLQESELFIENDYVFDLIETLSGKFMPITPKVTKKEEQKEKPIENKFDIKFSKIEKIRWEELILKIEKYISNTDKKILLNFKNKIESIDAIKRILELLKQKHIENDMVVSCISKLYEIANDLEIKTKFNEFEEMD